MIFDILDYRYFWSKKAKNDSKNVFSLAYIRKKLYLCSKI